MKSTELQPNRRVLIVDDNPSIHADFQKILAPGDTTHSTVKELEAALFEDTQPSIGGTSLELDSAYQGEEALGLVNAGLAENRPYAMAFVDVRMPPGWDGIETIARIWEVDPALQIVICTAYADYSWDDVRTKVGQSDSLLVLKKPFDNIEVQQLAHALTQKWLLNARTRLQVSELAQTNKSLAATEERFSKAFHTSPVAMAIHSISDRRFVDVNERMTKLTGYSREEMIGSASSDLFIWNTPHLVDQCFEALLREEIVRDQETEVRHHSGSLHQVLLSLSQVALAGQPHALLALQDITERNLLERQFRQAQKMEAIGQLAAGVAHDFNNILTVVQGHAGLLKNQIDSGLPATESAETIMKAADRASGLIRQLLMFSRKQVMQFRYLDLNEVLKNSLAMVGRLVGEHIRIEFSPVADLPSVHADPTMMEQVIMNLAVNARDAMQDGGTVTIKTEMLAVSREATPMDPMAREGQFVHLSFADTGCGMDTSTLSRLFEPFFTTKDPGKGTGLGMSTIFGIVRQHNGWLDVTSSPGSGSVFNLYFPACGCEAEKAQSPTDSTMLLRGHETVLVAEDEDALRDIVSLLLTTQGYKVITASSGAEAITMFEEADSPIDLLLTDMVMPGGVLGGELAERLRAKNQELKVIFTSGYSPGMAGRDISLLEGRNFLPKPYSIGKLAQFVREVLDRPEAGPDPQPQDSTACPA